MRKIKLGTPVRVEWEDAYSIEGPSEDTASFRKDHRPIVMVEYGILLKDDVDGVMTSPHIINSPWHGTQHKRGFFVPRGMVRSVKATRFA